MSFKKSPLALNRDGIAHYVLPLLVVLVIGVVGTFLIVASHAGSVKLPKVKSLSYSVPSSVKGSQKSDGWCGSFAVTYKVKTSGTVDTVMVRHYVQSDVLKTTRLTHVGGGNWKATETVERCVGKKGGKAAFPGYLQYDRATASYGEHSYSKDFLPKSVRIK